MTKHTTKVKVIATVTAICLLGDSMLYVVMPIYPEHFGLKSLWEVGVLLSVNRFVRIPMHPFINRFYIGHSIRRGMLIGLILSVVSTFLYGVLDSFYLLLMARILWGIAWAFLKQGGHLSVVEASRAIANQSGKLTGLYNGISRIGSLGGMLLGGIGIGLIGTDALSFIFAALSLIFIPFLVHFMRDEISIYTEQKIEKGFITEFKLLKSRTFISLMLSVFFVSLIYQGLLKSTLGFWVDEQAFTQTLLIGGIGAAALTGILQSLRWGMELIAAPWVGGKADKLGSKAYILLPSLIAAALLFPLLAVPLPWILWLIAVLLLLSTATIVSTLLDASVVDYTVTSTKKSVIAYSLMVSDIGAAVGPLAGFIFIEILGSSYVSWGGAAILLLTSVLVGWEYRNVTQYNLNRKREESVCHETSA